MPDETTPKTMPPRSFGGSVSAPLVGEELADRLDWFITLRWGVGGFLTGLSLLALGVLALPIPTGELLAVGLAVLAYNSAFHILRRVREKKADDLSFLTRFASLQIACDWLALVFVLHATGGVESPVLFFFVFHALLGSLLLPSRLCYRYAGLGVMLVGTIGLLEYSFVIGHHEMPGWTGDHYQSGFFILGTLAFFAFAQFGTTYLGSTIARRLWRRNQALISLKDDLEYAYKRTETLYGISQSVTSTLDLDQVLDTTVRLAAGAVNAKACSIRLLDERTGELSMEADFGLSDRYLGKGPVALSQSPLDWEALQGHVVMVADAVNDPRFQYPKEAEKEGIRAVLVVPMLGRERRVGVMRLYHGEVRVFTEDEIEFVTTLANQVTVAIENAGNYQRAIDLEKTKSDFVMTVAHELKSPIATTQSFFQILLDGYTGPLTDTQTDMIQRGAQRLEALQQLIRDLLALGALKGEPPIDRKSQVMLHGVLHRVIERLRAAAELKRLQLDIELPDGALLLSGVESDIERMLLNLVENAIRYTPDGGRVKAGFHREGEDRVVIEIADTGIGIPADARDRIFDEFFRASNAKEFEVGGTGLGLALVKRIVDRHRGHIDVQSQEGQGTTIRVTLPLDEPQG